MTDAPPFNCGTCRGEPAPPGTPTVREWDALYAARYESRPRWRDRLADLLFCTQCFRLRFSPGHLLALPYHDRGLRDA